ncbi:MAG: competence/damage-inducible protein A [Chloroflexi bacterium]|nr:competence/damage-inducible protein A [Chloroflexota bacterium]
MRAEILSVGTELLLGHITDTNAPYLAQHLAAMGIDLFWISQVGDNQARLVEVLGRAFGRSDLVVLTGGLGPTEDDLTREAIAELLGEQMAVEPELEKELRSAFARYGAEMPPHNIKQATLIPSAQALPNPVGTAPGWWVQNEGRAIVAMPGVPAEMRLMWENQVIPRLRAMHSGAIIRSRTLKVVGKGESAVEDMVRHLVSSTNPTLATYAKADGIHLRITAKAPDEGQAQQMIGDLEAKLRPILGSYVYGVDDDTLEIVVGQLLREKGLSLATMESMTGGLLASTITDAPGASEYFQGGIVAYANSAKVEAGVDERIIGDYGAVSAEVAMAMATAARKRLGTDVGLSITGEAGPDSSGGHPVGTVFVGLDLRGATQVSAGTHRAGRPEIKRTAVVRALNLLRRALLKD